MYCVKNKPTYFMSTKLTLTVDKNVIEKAKEYFGQKSIR